MKKHKKWVAIISYFKDPNKYTELIKDYLKEDENIILMIKKDEELGREGQKEIFTRLCEIFPKETKEGKIIISAVPDIGYIAEVNYV